MASQDEVRAKALAGAICRCALEKGRMFHRADCPLYPGEQFRWTAEQFREHAGLNDLPADY